MFSFVHPVISVNGNRIRIKHGLLEQQAFGRCHPDDAEIPFDWIVADITGKPGPYEFILTEPARCPTCKQVNRGKIQV
jgi:hypothetical protein